MNLTQSNFEKTNKEKWLKASEKFLKGKSYQDLIFRIDKNTSIEPYYTRSEQQALNHLSSLENDKIALNEAVNLPRFWYNQPIIGVKSVSDLEETNKEIRQVLMSGAEGVCLDMTNVEQNFKEEHWEKLLFEVTLPYCAISLIIDSKQATILRQFYHYVEQQGFEFSSLSGGIVSSLNLPKDKEQLEGLFKEGDINAQNRFYPISMKMATGKEPSEALTEVLISIHELVSNFGKGILNQIQFVAELSDDFFVSAAQIRALRWLLYQMYSLYKTDESPYFHAFTALGNDKDSKEDENWNLIRNTTQALSAALAGVDALTVRVHHHSANETTNWSKRVARNVSVMLREEAFIDKIADPIAGSYYIDHLTDEMCKNAWYLFQEKISLKN